MLIRPPLRDGRAGNEIADERMRLIVPAAIDCDGAMSPQPSVECARSAGFRIVGYYFASRVSDALARNAGRSEREQVPAPGIKGVSARLKLPARSEGFDELFYVRITPTGFDVQECAPGVERVDKAQEVEEV
jgi:hypothetical protein